GSTHGKAIETSPARNATGIRSAIEARELFVEPALELRVERPPIERDRARNAFWLLAPAAPPPGERADDAGRAENPGQRQHPGEQVEAVRRRRRRDPRGPRVLLPVHART